jgi:sulfopyruvate decarboxylase TPP-binding subunit
MTVAASIAGNANADAGPADSGSAAPFGAREVYRGLKAGRVDFAVYLPDSTFPPVARLLRADPEILTIQCAREDEGIALAAGAFLGGRVPVAVMEGSGLGYSALILARAQVQRTPVLVLASRTRALDEPFDFHAATRLAGEGVLSGLGIPYLTVDDSRQVARLVEKAVVTMRGQRTCVALLIPNFVIHEEPV